MQAPQRKGASAPPGPCFPRTEEERAPPSSRWAYDFEPKAGPFVAAVAYARPICGLVARRRRFRCLIDRWRCSPIAQHQLDLPRVTSIPSAITPYRSGQSVNQDDSLGDHSPHEQKGLTPSQGTA